MFRRAVSLALLLPTAAAAAMPALLSEDGPLEVASFLALALACLMSLRRLRGRALPAHIHVPTILFVLAEREAEPGLAFVSTALLDPAFWRAAALTPATAAGAALLVAVLLSLVTLPAFGVPAFRRAFRAGRRWPRMLLLAGAAAALSIGAEEMGHGVLWLAVEEGAELLFALLVLASTASRR